jgi:hypothetical protein
MVTMEMVETDIAEEALDIMDIMEALMDQTAMAIGEEVGAVWTSLPFH